MDEERASRSTTSVSQLVGGGPKMGRSAVFNWIVASSSFFFFNLSFDFIISKKKKCVSESPPVEKHCCAVRHTATLFLLVRLTG